MRIRNYITAVLVAGAAAIAIAAAPTAQADPVFGSVGSYHQRADRHWRPSRPSRPRRRLPRRPGSWLGPWPGSRMGPRMGLALAWGW